jgi:LPXTG-site transpeptidase (sortase) family protein
MRKSGRWVTVVFSTVIALGLSTVALAAVSIYQMNSSSGSVYLPELDSSFADNPTTLLPKPKVGDVIGTLSIPKIKKTINIIEGTGTKELKLGVGHYIGSVLPGVSDNSVLAGHRDSVFRNLGQLKIGDLMTVRTSYGTFVYEVHKIRIVNANDRTVIVPTKDAILTLSTCYPFRFVGNAPKRYVVQAGLVIGEPIA